MPLPTKQALARLEICSQCPEFRHLTKQCGICNCVMPIKVWLKSANCPKAFWPELVSNE